MKKYITAMKLTFSTNKYILTAFVITLVLGAQKSLAQSDWKASIGSQLYFAKFQSDNDLNTSYNPGLGLNIGISRSLNNHWSVQTGLRYGYLQTSNSLSRYMDSAPAIDSEGENFEFRYTVQNYSEKQRSSLLSLPLSIQFESSGSQTRFYSKLGASYNLFIGQTSQGKARTLTTSGFFERFNGELTAPAFAGFGTYRNIEFAKNDLELNNSANAFLELGIKSKEGDGWVYLGLFVEYGLNNLINNNNASLIDFNSNDPIDFINNSSLNATNLNTGTPLFNKISLNMIGFRASYEFNI